MSYYITTDTHFEHKNIINFGGRPEGFESVILENLEKRANRSNILIHLGDVSWRRDKYWHRQLTSMPYYKKWLILGNHDKKPPAWYLDNGWDVACERLTLTYSNKLISFTHKPTELLGEDINIHGHFHNIPMERIKEKEPELFRIHHEPGHILLAVEHHYTPFNLEQLIK